MERARPPPKKMDSAGPLNYYAQQSLPVTKPVGGPRGLKFHAKRGSHYDISVENHHPLLTEQQIGFPSGNGLHEIALVARAALPLFYPELKQRQKSPSD